jgi:tRNA(fMet)-specific endonuclease VapC
LRLTYHLDTNVVIALLRNKPARVRDRFRGAVSGDALIHLSSVVLFELWHGVARSGRRQENTERLRVLLAGTVTIVPFEEKDAAIAGDLRATLEIDGTPIGPYDLMIAAQALRTGATLVTANVSEFARITGLTWEDWTVET